MKTNGYNTFLQYKVEAQSLEEFLNKYTKHERHGALGEEYVECRMQSHKSDLENFGYTIISAKDSATGKIVAYYQN